MNRNDGSDASFDPRTWGVAAPASPSSTQHPAGVVPDEAAASFDPHTWIAADTAISAPATAERAVVPAGAPPYALAVGASAVILLGGAALAWSMHRAPVAPIVAATPMPEAEPQPAAAAVAAVVAAPPASLPDASRRSLVIASVADVGPTLAAAGIVPAQVRAAVGAAEFALGHESGEVHLVLDLVADGAARRLTRLEATREDGAGVTLVRQADGSYASQVLQAKLTTKVKVVRGEMDATSFYSAAVTAGVTDSLISDFANAFSFDFDFQRDVKPGDIFEAAFEQKVNPSGDPVGPPSLIYVSLQTAEKSKALYHFLVPGDATPGWFDGNGKSTVRALMRTPVDGARISSTFGMRLHPVLGFMKLHKGIDFAAPIGTPIYAAGDAVVQWAAMKGPNGNLTILKHDNGWQTYYLHQSLFMPGIAPGARVHQGEQIGAIGTTGRSTGPHLHYEVHIDGQAVDPAGIPTGTGKTLGAGALAAFRKERDRIDAARATSAG